MTFSSAVISLFTNRVRPYQIRRCDRVSMDSMSICSIRFNRLRGFHGEKWKTLFALPS